MKTIFYLTGDRHSFKSVRAASQLTAEDAKVLLNQLKREGKMAFCLDQGKTLKSADDFNHNSSREKYWIHIMRTYFENN